MQTHVIINLLSILTKCHILDIKTIYSLNAEVVLGRHHGINPNMTRPSKNNIFIISDYKHTQ